MKSNRAALQYGKKPNRFSSSVTFEEFNFPFVLLGRVSRGEGPQVTPLAGFGILLTGI